MIKGLNLLPLGGPVLSGAYIARPLLSAWLQYNLPHQFIWLEHPPTKYQVKKIAKSKVVDYWEQKLKKDASTLSSLQYFKPEYMSLASDLAVSRLKHL